MARYSFGGNASDYVASNGRPRVGVAVTFWTAQTGGSQVTDLLDADGDPITQVVSGAEGLIPVFEGPDGVVELWALAGGARVRLEAHDEGPLGGGGGGAVDSVNGETGVVVLSAADVGADPAGTAATLDAALDTRLDTVEAALPGKLDSTTASATFARKPARMFYLNAPEALGGFGAVAYSTQAAAVAGTDATAAIIAATDAAHAAGGGTVMFDPGYYRVSGALRTDRQGNAQIPMPMQSHTLGTKLAITWHCHEAAAAEMYPSNVSSHSETGAILVSTLTSRTYSATFGPPSVVGSPTVEGSGSSSEASFTNIYFTTYGVAVRCQPNPSLMAWDLGGVIAGDFQDARADTTEIGSVINNEPTNTHAWAMRMPRNNNNVLNRLGHFTANGYWGGIAFGEHAVIDNVQLLYCKVALIPLTLGGAHAAQLRAISVERCPNVLAYALPATGVANSTARASFNIEHLDIEDVSASGQWWSTLTHVNDVNSSFDGEVQYSLSGAATTNALTVIGGTNLDLVNRRTRQHSRPLALGPAVSTASTIEAGSITVPGLCAKVVPFEFNGTTYYLPAFAAGPTTLVSHSFTAADSASAVPAPSVGTAGTALAGTWGISSNKLYSATTTGSSYNPYVWNSGSGEGAIQVDITLSPSTAAKCGVVVRAADVNNFIMVEFIKSGGSDTITIYKRVAGTYTGLASGVAPITPVNPAGLVLGTTYTVKVTFIGTTIRVFLNGVLTAQAIASTGLEANTKHGVMVVPGSDNGAASRFDDLLITDR